MFAFLAACAVALAAPVAAQSAPIDPFFFSGFSVQSVVVAVLVTVVWGFLPIWFMTVGGGGVLQSADFATIRRGIATRFCGLLLLKRGVEKTIDLFAAIFFIVAASIYLVQPMLQFALDEAGEVDETLPLIEIANDNTLWVSIVIVAYAAWFVQRAASGVFHSISEFGWSALLSFIAWAGWVTLVILLAIELSSPQPGQELTAEIVLIIFAALQFIWSTYLAVWRLGFAYVANELAIGPQYELAGASGGKSA